MQAKQRVKMTIDIVMTILSIILMGGTMMFANDKIHQILGMALLALWIIHTILNRRWYSSIFKGKHPPYRIMQIVVNLGIALCAVCLMISGLMMAWFMPIPNGLGIARAVHLVSSHWYYIFMCAHLGMHLGMIFSRIFSASSENSAESRTKARTVIFKIIVLLICIYGIYAFILRGFWKYIFYSQQFFFFDLERGYFLFALDYFSVLILMATLSYLFGKFLQNRAKKS